MSNSIQVVVDKATFLSHGRIFKNAYRPNCKKIILTLANGRLRIEFDRGGCELPCDTPQPLVAELTAKEFAGIVSAHRHDKPVGTITLTFRPELGEFATPLAGGKAKFLSLSKPNPTPPSS